MRFLLLAVLVLLAVGCDTGSKHNFFKPEISGAVYAAPNPAGDPTADEAGAARDDASRVVKLKLERPNTCVYMGPEEGWTCTGETWDENGRYVLADDDTYNAAPRFVPIASRP